MAKTQGQTQDARPKAGGVVTAQQDESLGTHGIAEVRVNLASGNQPDFVLGNVTVVTVQGIALYGFRVLRGQEQYGSRPYLEVPGIPRRDANGNRRSPFQIVELPPLVRNHVTRIAFELLGLNEEAQ